MSFIDSLKDKIEKAPILLCQLESNLDATREALYIAGKKSLTRILNPAPINEAFTSDLLQHVNVITPNESEFLYLIKKLGYSSVYDTTQKLIEETITHPSIVHELCNEIPVDTTVITLGDIGCFVSHRNKQKGYYRIPAKNVKTVDTTGAGDAFSGGLAAALFKKGKDNFKEAVEYATIVAALSTTKQGTAPSMPTADQVNDLIKKRIKTSG